MRDEKRRANSDAREIIANELIQLDDALSSASMKDGVTPIHLLSIAFDEAEGQQYRKTLLDTQTRIVVGDYDATLKYLACRLTNRKDIKNPTSLKLYDMLRECVGKADEEIVFVTGYRFVPDKRTMAVYYIGMVQQKPLFALLLSGQRQLEQGIDLIVI